MGTYVFDPEWTAELERLRALEALFDRPSARYLSETGVGEGWRCLEVGCGAGGLARWLAERVRPSGRVVAIDLDTRFADGHGLDNLEVRRHDLMAAELEDEAFDLAHARAVIEHIPDHQGALERMVAAVRPGGWVVIEEVDFGGRMAAALSDYAVPGEHLPLMERLYGAIERMFASIGGDARYGTRLLAGMEAAGLEHLGGELHTPIVTAGQERWTHGTVAQLGPRMVSAGLLTEDELADFLALPADGSVRYLPPMMVTVWGRRPAA
jgi:SAM-dependent methyltransferase